MSCYRNRDGVPLDVDQIVVSINKINHSMRENNPLDSVCFFDGLDDT